MGKIKRKKSSINQKYNHLINRFSSIKWANRGQPVKLIETDNFL